MMRKRGRRGGGGGLGGGEKRGEIKNLYLTTHSTHLVYEYTTYQKYG